MGLPEQTQLGLLGLLLLLGLTIWRAMEKAWWKPRQLERALRSQGLRGTSYRFPAGDMRDYFRLNAEALSKPLPLSKGAHNITPRIEPLLHRTMLEYGKIYFHWFGSVPRVTINDPELVKEVLSNKFGHFGKVKNSLVSKVVIKGIVSYEGEKWAKHRRILNPAFHMEKLKRMVNVFSTCCENLINTWEMQSITQSGSIEMDMWPQMNMLTGDVISKVAFGSNYQEGKKIFELQADQVKRVLRAIKKSYIPGYRFLPTENNIMMGRNDREIATLLRGIVEKRKNSIIRDKETSQDDLLGLMLESNMQSSDRSDKSELSMTTYDIIEECKLFYFAGMETTSVLLTWTLIILSMHPEWQNCAREEVLSVCGKSKPTADALGQLKIVTMILYEVLRLYPPVALMFRQTYKSMNLGGVIYPPGVTLVLPIAFIHHDPIIWGEDVNEFIPKRFAEGISKATSNPFAFIPFGGGPRICIGQNFALLEAKMGLSMILQKFAFELSPSYVHAPHRVLTLHPQYGAQIRLHKL